MGKYTHENVPDFTTSPGLNQSPLGPSFQDAPQREPQNFSWAPLIAAFLGLAGMAAWAFLS